MVPGRRVAPGAETELGIKTGFLVGGLFSCLCLCLCLSSVPTLSNERRPEVPPAPRETTGMEGACTSRELSSV